MASDSIQRVLLLLFFIPAAVLGRDGTADCLVAQYQAYVAAQTAAYREAERHAISSHPDLAETIEAWVQAQVLLLETGERVVTRLAATQRELLHTTQGIPQLPKPALNCGPDCTKPAYRAMLKDSTFQAIYPDYYAATQKYVFLKDVPKAEKARILRAAEAVGERIKASKSFPDLMHFYNVKVSDVCPL